MKPACLAFSGDWQRQLRGRLPGQALRDWRDGRHQEGSAGQKIQEQRTPGGTSLQLMLQSTD